MTGAETVQQSRKYDFCFQDTSLVFQPPFPGLLQRSCSALLHFVVPEKHQLLRQVIHFVATPF